jgi:hypothetical protein
MTNYNVPCSGSVEPNFVEIGRIFTQVLDVTQDMTSAVLACDVSKMCTHAHVRGSGLLQSPFSYRKALKQGKSSTINQIVTDFLEVLGQLRQRKILLFEHESVSVR